MNLSGIKKNIDARASENIWFFAKIIMKSIFYEWIEFKYELPSLSPTNRLWLFEFFPPKNERNYSTQMEIQKKNYEINNKSILTILQTRIYQTNELKYIQNDQKKFRFYLFNNRIYLGIPITKSKWENPLKSTIFWTMIHLANLQ